MRHWHLVALTSAALVPVLACTPAQAQVGAPSEDDLKAAPPQFRSAVSGGKFKPADEELNRPVLNATPPSADLRDFNGIYSALRRTGTAGGPPAPRPAGATGPAPEPVPGSPNGPSPTGAGAAGPGYSAPAAPGGGGRSNVGSRACVYRSFPGLTSYSTTIIQNDWSIVLLMEENHPMRWARFTDKHDPAFTPNYSGDSIAHWEGNTLVIDTVGVKVEGGSDLKHYVEKLEKQPNGNILIERFEVKADGTQQSVDKSGLRWRPDLHYVEDICEDLGEAFGSEYQ